LHVNPPPPQIRILLVDDSILVREGLRAVLATHGHQFGFEVVGEAETVAAAIAQCSSLKPDVILLDVRLPDGSGVEACKKLLLVSPRSQILILTSVATNGLVHAAVMAGARGYLMKEINSAALIHAVVEASQGRSAFTPEISHSVVRSILERPQTRVGSMLPLSPQEQRVLALVAEGLTNKEVGERLHLSNHTVKNYLVSVFGKLQVKRRSQAVAAYLQDTRPDP
jgi:two-component system, NarL family, response regulator DevR